MRNFKNVIAFLLAALLLSCCAGNDGYRIAIQPLGTVNTQYTDSVKRALTNAYKADVVILPAVEIPERFSIHVKNFRYRADSIIHFLATQRRDSIDAIVGITESDISMTKRDAAGNVKEPKEHYEDWGVMGLAFTPGTSCVISTYRIKNADPEKHSPD